MRFPKFFYVVKNCFFPFNNERVNSIQILENIKYIKSKINQQLFHRENLKNNSFIANKQFS